jgi:hypothetical protein
MTDQENTNSNPIAIPYSPIAVGVLVSSFCLYVLVICCCLYQAICSDEKLQAAETASQDDCIYCSRSRRVRLNGGGSQAGDGEVFNGILHCPVHGQPCHTNFHLQTHSNLPNYPPSLQDPSSVSVSSHNSAGRPPSYKSSSA